MPKYRIQLKQGSRTITNHIEAKSVNDVLALFQTLSTMQVSEILEIKYTDETLPPVDDMLYFPFVKIFANNEASRKSQQFLLHNIKLTKNSVDIDQALRQHCEIDTLAINSTHCGLFKSPKN
jgi:hypothetical protein